MTADQFFQHTYLDGSCSSLQWADMKKKFRFCIDIGIRLAILLLYSYSGGVPRKMLGWSLFPSPSVSFRLKLLAGSKNFHCRKILLPNAKKATPKINFRMENGAALHERHVLLASTSS